jgi:hypothetical protein
LYFLTTKTPSTPRSYEYKGHQYSWRSPRLGGEIQDYLLEMALASMANQVWIIFLLFNSSYSHALKGMMMFDFGPCNPTMNGRAVFVLSPLIERIPRCLHRGHKVRSDFLFK